MFKDLTLDEVFNKESLFESLVPGTGIVLIGKASFGPSMVPIKATSIEQVITTFGVESELSNAYMEISMSDASDIYLMKVNGTHAETNIQNKIKLISLEAIESSNFLEYEIFTSGDDRYLTLTNERTGYDTSYYISGKTIDQVVSEINVDAITLQSPVYATALFKGSTSVLIDEYPSEAQTDGANSELGLISYVDKVIDALDLLEAYPVAQIGILCAQFNKESIYKRIGDFIQKKTRSCMPCMVTIGIDQYLKEEDASIRDYFDAVATMFATTLNTESPVNEFINVIIAKLKFSNLHENYISNGVASYCGIIDASDYYEGTTNKRIPGTAQDLLSFTDEQKSSLSDIGYVVTTKDRQSAENQIRILKGRNLSLKVRAVIDAINPKEKIRYIPTPLSNTANVKLVQHLVYKLNDILQVDEISKISTLKSRIINILNEESDYIKDYKIDVSQSYQGFSKTYVVGLEITPVGETNSLMLSLQTQ